MEGAAMAILSNGGQLLTDEYRLLQSVGPSITDLRDDLDTMTALLIMHSEAAGAGDDDHFVRVWMNQLRELAYDADDCIDLYKLRIKSRPTDGVLLRLKRLFGTLLARRRLAGEIAALRSRAVAIGDRHARFGGGVDRDALRRRRTPSSSSSSAPIPPAHALQDDHRYRHPVSIEDQAEAMAKKLMVRDDGGEISRRAMVLSIVGFGGLGKTTLAKEVCRRLEDEFPYQAMVSVSQAFELEELCKRVLEQMEMVKAENARGTKEDGETPLLAADARLSDNNKDPALKLMEFLKDKRYLNVIDDAWTMRAWDAIQSILLLQENNSYSRIIVTTRIETVAKACSPAIAGQHFIHQLQRLKPEDSKKLFHVRTFGDKECPKELASTTEKILRRCAGLPLAIVSIANVLAGYTSAENKYKWESIYNSMGSQMESNPTLEGMKQIITLNYNHISHELKSCMLYLSIFPEDYEIDKHRLLCRWIAEGLVMERRGLTLMEVAESYLDELVSRNMIEVRVDFDYYWRVKLCRVHDMLLEVIVSKSLESNFVSLLGGQYARLSYGRIRRLSIQRGNNERRPSQDTEPQQSNKNKMPGVHGIEAMDVKHVRSLSMFQDQGKNLLDRIDKFTLLRVLDLEGCEGISDHHMKRVCGLYLLKFLNLRGTDIRQVPPEIKKLEHLQTLDVRDTRVEGLPDTVNELHNLERLQISHSSEPKYMWLLPLGLNKMKSLREVAFSTLGNDAQVAEEIGDLEHLEELSVYADTAMISDGEVLPALAKSLSKSYSLRHLIIGDVGFAKGALDFLHGMPQPPRLLRHLMIAGGINGGLPSWIGSLAHLVQFSMSWGQLVGDQLLDALCELPSLKIICVHQMCHVDRELVARARHRFPELSDLRVSCNYEEPNVLRFEEGSMAKLERLLFNFIDFEKRIDGVEYLAGLKEVHLWGRKNNPALERALEQLKVENQRRGKEFVKQFQITVKYE